MSIKSNHRLSKDESAPTHPSTTIKMQMMFAMYEEATLEDQKFAEAVKYQYNVQIFTANVKGMLQSSFLSSGVERSTIMPKMCRSNSQSTVEIR